MNYPSEKDDWKKLSKVIQRFLLMCHMLKRRPIYPTYGSKYNSKREKQNTLLMIQNKKKYDIILQ